LPVSRGSAGPASHTTRVDRKKEDNMRRSAWSWSLVLVALLAVVAVAQVEESITGTVVSFDSQLLVIHTDDGQLSLAVSSDAEVPPTLAQNSKVQVWYEVDASGDKLVRRVALADEVIGGTATAPMAEPMDTGAEPMDTGETAARFDEPVADHVAEQPADTTHDTLGAETTAAADAAATDELPATASALPLLGLLGLAAAAAGLALRVHHGS
jgi:hypothetical protein